MRARYWLFVIPAFFAAFSVNAEDLGSLARKAIVTGKVQKAVLDGGAAEKIKSTTTSTEPVHAKVSVIKKFKQKGCARLSIELSQDKVPSTDGKLFLFKLPMEMNLCEDGSAPNPAPDVPTGNLKVNQFPQNGAPSGRVK